MKKLMLFSIVGTLWFVYLYIGLVDDASKPTRIIYTDCKSPIKQIVSEDSHFAGVPSIISGVNCSVAANTLPQ